MGSFRKLENTHVSECLPPRRAYRMREETWLPNVQSRYRAEAAPPAQVGRAPFSKAHAGRGRFRKFRYELSRDLIQPRNFPVGSLKRGYQTKVSVWADRATRKDSLCILNR